MIEEHASENIATKEKSENTAMIENRDSDNRESDNLALAKEYTPMLTHDVLSLNRKQKRTFLSIARKNKFRLIKVILGDKNACEAGWNKGGENQNNYEYDYYNGFNIGVRSGDGLVIIDFDWRDYTDESRSFLADLFEHLPETITVLSASQKSNEIGFHLYYSCDKDVDLGTFYLYPGIEIRYENHYCVAPSSYNTFESSFYKFKEDTVIEENEETNLEVLPDFILTEWLEYRTKNQNEYIEKRDDSEYAQSDICMQEITIALNEIPSDIGYDIWLRMGMALHSTNNKDALQVFESWSAKSKGQTREGGKPVYREGGCEKKFISFSKSDVTHLSIFRQANISNPNWMDLLPNDDEFWDNFISEQYFSPPTLAEIDPLTHLRCNPDVLMKFAESCPHFAELVRCIYNSASNSMPHFAASTALTKISSACKDKVTSMTGSTVNLFTIIHIDSGAGKKHYTDQVQKHGIFSTTPGSGVGLQSLIKDIPHVVFLAEEIGQFLKPMIGKRPDNKMSASIQDFMLKAYDGTEQPFHATKENLKDVRENGETPVGVSDYSFSVFGSSTSQMIQEFICDENMAEAGFVNRFMFFGDTGYTDKNAQIKNWKSKTEYPAHFSNFIEAMSKIDAVGAVAISCDDEWLNDNIYTEYRILIGSVHGDALKTNLIRRTYQNAMRVASLIWTYEVASSSSWHVDAPKDVVRWAWQFAKKSAEDSFKLIDDHRKRQPVAKNTEYAEWLDKLSQATQNGVPIYRDTVSPRKGPKKIEYSKFIKCMVETGDITMVGKKIIATANLPESK